MGLTASETGRTCWNGRAARCAAPDWHSRRRRRSGTGSAKKQARDHGQLTHRIRNESLANPYPALGRNRINVFVILHNHGPQLQGVTVWDCLRAVKVNLTNFADSPCHDRGCSVREGHGPQHTEAGPAEISCPSIASPSFLESGYSPRQNASAEVDQKPEFQNESDRH